MDLDYGIGALDKELRIRKRVLSIYNSDPADFGSKQEYDDFLEEVEDIIWRLANNVDVDKTEAQIRKYRSENQHLINAKVALKAAAPELTQAPALDISAAASSLAAAVKAAGLGVAGMPAVLPRLAHDYVGSLLDGARNIKYDWRSQHVVRANAAAAAAAGGWNAGVGLVRVREEALASLLASG